MIKLKTRNVTVLTDDEVKLVSGGLRTMDSNGCHSGGCDSGGCESWQCGSYGCESHMCWSNDCGSYLCWTDGNCGGETYDCPTGFCNTGA